MADEASPEPPAPPLLSGSPAPPWDSALLYPESPAPDGYGYLAGSTLHACTPDELVKKCSAVQIPDIGLVWTPEDPRLVPITEVALLRPALLARYRSSLAVAFFTTFTGLLMIGIDRASRSSRPTWPFWTIFIVVPGLQSGIAALFARRALLRSGEGKAALSRDTTARFASWIASQRARVAKGLVGAIVLVGLCQLLHGLESSVAAAGLVKDAVREGQYWRTLTAGTLHANGWHLFGNMAALLALGRIVEVLAHWSRLAIVFLLSVFVGSLFSLVLLPDATSVGASGGLMGLLGFLIVLGVRLSGHGLPPRFGSSLIQGVLWVAATGLIAHAFIDNAAHAGGLLTGLLLGHVLVTRGSPLPLTADRGLMRAGIASLVVLALVVSGAAALLLRGVLGG